MRQRITVLFLLFLLINGRGLGTEPTDRNVLLKRNNPVVQSFDSLATLFIGNGEFAMSVDPTGLQTFPERYTQGNELVTQSGWIHRHLGIIGFELPPTTTTADFSDVTQTLILNSGFIKSNYTLQENPVSVYTVCHPHRNIIASHVKAVHPIPIKLCFPYTTRELAPLLWDKNQHHSTRLVSKRNNSAVFKRSIGADVYYVILQWQGDVSIVEKAANYYVITPEKGHFAFSCEFLPQFSTTFNDIVLPTFKDTAEESATAWNNFWNGDCLQLISDSTYSYTRSEEQRLILDCYKREALKKQELKRMPFIDSHR